MRSLVHKWRNNSDPAPGQIPRTACPRQSGTYESGPARSSATAALGRQRQQFVTSNELSKLISETQDAIEAAEQTSEQRVPLRSIRCAPPMPPKLERLWRRPSSRVIVCAIVSGRSVPDLLRACTHKNAMSTFGGKADGHFVLRLGISAFDPQQTLMKDLWGSTKPLSEADRDFQPASRGSQAFSDCWPIGSERMRLPVAA
jgi:hypothetical protein